MCKAGEIERRGLFLFLACTTPYTAQPHFRSQLSWWPAQVNFVSVTRPTDNPQSGGGAWVAGADEGGGGCTR